MHRHRAAHGLPYPCPDGGFEVSQSQHLRFLSGRFCLRGDGGQRLEAEADGLGALFEHLALVVADRAEEVAASALIEGHSCGWLQINQ